MDKVAIYVRVSTIEQALEDKVSLDQQEKDCRAYAARMEWEVTITVGKVTESARRPESSR